MLAHQNRRVFYGRSEQENIRRAPFDLYSCEGRSGKRLKLNSIFPIHPNIECYALEIWICSLETVCANWPGAMRTGFSLQLTSIFFCAEAKRLLVCQVLETGDRVGN